MARDWDSFVQEYAKEQYENAIFNLTRVVAPQFESPIERIMYVVLRDEFNNGFDRGMIKLECQKKIGKYTVDFYLLYMSDTGPVEFIIECDGHNFHEKTKEQAKHDKKRDRFFTSNGYIVLRYTGSEIVGDYRNLTKPIWSVIVQRDQVI